MQCVLFEVATGPRTSPAIRSSKCRGRKVLIRYVKVDRVVDSCFQLLSLFFMTIGRNNEAPAAYALTSTIRRLLDHLTEADVYSAKDLESMSHTLDHLSEIIHSASDTKSAPFLETLLANRIERCRASLERLREKLEDIAEPLRSTAEKLVSMLRQMAVTNSRSKVRSKKFASPT